MIYVTHCFSIIGKPWKRLLSCLRCTYKIKNTSLSCFLLKTTINCCGYRLSISLSTTMILNLLLIHFHAWEFERPFCLRCLNEIANLCATYGHHMLLLLTLDSLPLQLHFTPFPSKQKKRQTISVYALTKGKAQDVSFHGGSSTFSNSFDKTKFLISAYRWTHR